MRAPLTRSDYAAIVVASLDLFVGAYYCLKLIRKESHPRLATWLIFEIGEIMSLITYFTSHNHSIVKAALNVTDGFVVNIILAALLFVHRPRSLRLTRNESLCLVVSSISLAAWAITKTAWIGFAGFQIVMSLAYVPTIENLWRWRPVRTPEPIASWSVNALAALIGVLIDVTGAHHDYLAMLYPLRAFILCLTVTALLIRWRHKSHIHASS